MKTRKQTIHDVLKQQIMDSKFWFSPMSIPVGIIPVDEPRLSEADIAKIPSTGMPVCMSPKVEE